VRLQENEDRFRNVIEQAPVAIARRYFNITYSRVIDKDGTAFILHMCSDVTEQVLAKKQIEYSEAEYRRLFETMDQGFSIIEMIFDDVNKPVDSLFLEINSVFEKQSGFKGAVGKKIRQIVPDIEDKWFE
jgi:PAS domain-containing protein